MGIHNHLQTKIAAFIGLGTVVALGKVDNKILKLVDRLYLLEVCSLLNIKQILMLPKLLTKAFATLAYNSRIHFNIVMLFVRLLCGFSVENKIPKEYFGVMLAQEPGGASVNNLKQWVDCYRNGQMRRFNHGPKKNQEVYGAK
jgi:hypothetical protein